jgi:hypothetical protein
MAAAAAVATAAMSAATTPVATMTSAAMAAAAAVADKLHHRRCIGAFFVEDVERCQANVWDFLLSEEDLIAISVAWSG